MQLVKDVKCRAIASKYTKKALDLEPLRVIQNNLTLRESGRRSLCNVETIQDYSKIVVTLKL